MENLGCWGIFTEITHYSLIIGVQTFREGEGGFKIDFLKIWGDEREKILIASFPFLIKFTKNLIFPISNISNKKVQRSEEKYAIEIQNVKPPPPIFFLIKQTFLLKIVLYIYLTIVVVEGLYACTP